MHRVILSQPCQRADGTEVPAGSFICDDLNAAELMVAAERGTARASHFEIPPAWFTRWMRLPRVGCRVLVIHPGGFGDQLLLEPVLRAMKETASQVAVSCRERTRCVFDHTSVPDAFEPYPLPESALANYDLIVSGENLNESDPLGRTLHASDAKANRWKVEHFFALQNRDRKPHYIVTGDEAAWAESTYPRKSTKVRGRTPRLGVQLRSSSITRDYPPPLLGRVMEEMFSRFWEIYLFGSPGSIPMAVIPQPARSRVINLAHDKLTFRQSAAVAQTCDVIVAPDSALMHLAGTLGLPCVALFGPIPAALRTAYYPSVTALQDTSACPMAPCFHHPRALGSGFLAWPNGGPCIKAGHCTVLAATTPTQVTSAIINLFEASK